MLAVEVEEVAAVPETVALVIWCYNLVISDSIIFFIKKTKPTILIVSGEKVLFVAKGGAVGSPVSAEIEIVPGRTSPPPLPPLVGNGMNEAISSGTEYTPKTASALVPHKSEPEPSPKSQAVQPPVWDHCAKLESSRQVHAVGIALYLLGIGMYTIHMLMKC